MIFGTVMQKKKQAEDERTLVTLQDSLTFLNAEKSVSEAEVSYLRAENLLQRFSDKPCDLKITGPFHDLNIDSLKLYVNTEKIRFEKLQESLPKRLVCKECEELQ